MPSRPGEPNPTTIGEAYGLALSLIALIGFIFITSFCLFGIGNLTIDSAKESDECNIETEVYSESDCQSALEKAENTQDILDASGIFILVVGAIAVQYKLLIDVISIGVFRGINVSNENSASKNINTKSNSNKNSIIIQCENCGQNLRIPSHLSGHTIKCAKCSHEFKNHHETDQSSASSSI